MKLYPNENIIYDYMINIFNMDKRYKILLNEVYTDIKTEYPNPIDFINFKINKDMYTEKKLYLILKIQVFLSLHFRYAPNHQIDFRYSRELYIKILKYFKLVDENFINIWSENDKNHKVTFILFKLFLYNNEFNIYNIEKRQSNLELDKIKGKVMINNIYFLDINLLNYILESKFAYNQNIHQFIYILDISLYKYKEKIRLQKNDIKLFHNYPKEDELINYLISNFNAGKQTIRDAKSHYIRIKKIYPNPIDFINKQMNLSNENRIDLRIQLFLCIKFRCKFKSQLGHFKSDINLKILKYFNLIDDKFLNIWTKDKDEKFNSFLLKLYLYNEKFDIYKIDVIDDEIVRFINNHEQFNKDKPRVRRFIYKLDKAIVQYKGKGNKKKIYSILRDINIEDFKRYGTNNKKIIKIINEFLEMKTIQGFQIRNSLSHISIFFKWIKENFGELEDINDLNKEKLQNYIKYLDYNYQIQNTKYKHNYSINSFIIWLSKKNYLNDNEIVALATKKIKFGSKDKDNPRMFDSRKHFMQVVNALQSYNPIDEDEFILKNICLIGSATGLRLEEIRWLDENCLIESSEVVGIIQLNTLDKTSIINKKTCIQKWGMAALEDCKERFKSRNNIKVYNKKLKKYVYSLFEVNGELISEARVNSFLKDKIFKNIEFYNDSNQRVFYDGIKFQAFRHQKGNDTYKVTGGNLKRVQIALSHRKVNMTKKYTVKENRELKKEIIKAIESNTLVGKGSELIKELLNINMMPDEYIEIYKKLNISKYNNISNHINNLKFVGFGFCRNSSCKKIPMCEGCNYFLTNSKYLDALKVRYSINYILTNNLIGNIDKDKLIQYIDSNLELSRKVQNLKYQEKWLVELGVSNNEINELRRGSIIKYADSNSNYRINSK